jgi:hypothetical protein
MSCIKGSKLPEDHKRRISAALAGRMPKNIALINANKSGEGNPMFGTHTGQKQKDAVRLATKGKKRPLEVRLKMSIAHKERVRLGLHPGWKGGVTPINKRIRHSLEFRLWREAVFKRDNWTCVWCGKRGGILHPDHIKPFALFPELRFAIDNGRTLCVDCHKKTDTWGYRTRKLSSDGDKISS